jgi:hypothetical protein
MTITAEDFVVISKAAPGGFVTEQDIQDFNAALRDLQAEGPTGQRKSPTVPRS